MKAIYINPFLDSTLNLFENMTGRRPEPGKKSLLQNFYSHRWDISGVIGVTGASEGILSIRMTRVMVEKILIKTGIPYNEDDDFSELATSMVGEMANIIAGNALTGLGDYDIDITVPIVVQGKDHTISWPRNNPVIVIPFASAYGPFEVCVSLRDNMLHSFI